jgi:hypothetical protein
VTERLTALGLDAKLGREAIGPIPRTVISRSPC